MRTGNNAQLAQELYSYDTAGSAAWQKARLELLKPQQKQKRAQRRRERASYTLLAILVFFSALAYMYLEARINIAGREVTEIQNQIAEAQKLSLRTELEIGSLSSLSRVESYAKLHLGMVYPEVKSVHYLSQQASAELDTKLRLLAEESALLGAEEPILVAEEALTEEYPLFVAWAQLIDSYFKGTALAVE